MNPDSYIEATLLELGGTQVRYDPSYPAWRAEFPPHGGVAVVWPSPVPLTRDGIVALVGAWAHPPVEAQR